MALTDEEQAFHQDALTWLQEIHDAILKAEGSVWMPDSINRILMDLDGDAREISAILDEAIVKVKQLAAPHREALHPDGPVAG